MATGAKGGQLGDANVVKFLAWVEERRLNNDWHLYVRGGKLNRREVAREMGCGVSALNQNRRIKRRLHLYELILGAKGILGIRTEPTADELLQQAEAAGLRNNKLVQTLSRKVQHLEAKLAELEARNALLQEKVDQSGLGFDQGDLVEDLLVEFGTTPH